MSELKEAKITLQLAVQMLNSAAAVIVDDDILIYTGEVEIPEDLDNEFMMLSWSDDDGNEFSYSYFPKDNQTPTVRGNHLFLRAEGDTEDTKFTLLEVSKLDWVFTVVSSIPS
jgi:hypothetical protein